MDMKCRKCETELSDDDEFCVRCGTAVSDATVFYCSGRKKDGTPCSAKLQQGLNFCRKCGQKVDMTLFQNKQTKCQGVMKDGSLCISVLEEEDEYCVKCGTFRAVAILSSEVASCSSDQYLNTIDSSAIEAANNIPYSKLDGGNNVELTREENKEQTLTPLFPSSSSALSPGNLTCVFGLNAPLDGEGTKALSEEKGNNFEHLSADQIDDDKESYEGNNNCSYGSCSDSTDMESVDEEASRDASSQEQKGNRSKRKRKQSRCMTNFLKKMKMMENIQNSSPAKSGEPQQAANQESVEEQESYLQHMQESILADYISVADVGLITSQMEKDECQMAVKNLQDGDTIRKYESLTKGVQGNNNEFDDAKNWEQLNKVEDMASVETGQSFDKIDEMCTYIQHDNATEGQTSSGTVGTEPNLKKANTEKLDIKTVEVTNDGQNIQQDSQGAQMSKDKIDKTNSGNTKNESSQNACSEASASGGVGTERNTSQRSSAECISVHFHALMSPEFDVTPADVVMVQFEDELEWQSCWYHCALVRKTDDQHTEIKLEIDISKSRLFNKNKTKYKYVVAKDGTRQDKDHKHISEHYHAKRSLHLPDEMKNMAEWHQYDGIIFPKPEEGLVQKVKNLFGGNIREREKADLVLSVEYFLPKFYKDIINGQHPAMPLDEALTQLEQLLHTLRRVYLVERKCYTNKRDYEKKISDMILGPMLKSFEEIPLNAWKESPVESEIRMLRSTTVVSALKCFNRNLNLEEQELLAKGLFVRPNYESQPPLCYDLNCIQIYSQEMRKHLSDALISFIDSISKTTRSPCVFFCIPLHHFLIGAVRPFEEVCEHLGHDNEVPTWWGTASITKSVESFKKGSSLKGAVKFGEVISFLHPLFEMDYLLPRTIMAMLTLNEVEEAIKTGRIPFEVCAANLTYFVKTSRLNDIKLQKVGAAIYSLTDVCRAAKMPVERSKLIQATMFYKIAVDLLKETLKCNVQYLVVGAAQIFLHAVAVYDMIRRIENSEKPNTRQRTDHFAELNRLYESVKWFQGRFYQWTQYFVEYLNHWNNIFAPHDLPSEAVKDAWNDLAERDLHNTLREQMRNFTTLTGHLIEVYCRDLDSFHLSVQKCLGKLAFKAIETGYDVQMSQLGDHERKRFRILLCSFFEREWEAAMKKRGKEEQLILHHILTWGPFSHFLKMFYGNEKELYLDQSQTCLELIQAVSLIEDRVLGIENGTITLTDFAEIKAAEDRFQKLIAIMFEKSKGQNSKPLNVAKAVKIRQMEVDSYYTQKKYVTTLVQLCQHVHSVQLENIGLDKTMRYLEEEQNLCIKDICQPTNVESAVPEKCEPKITAFKLSDSVVQVLKPLHESFKSSIFLNLWQDIGHASKAKTLDDVCEQVWKPVSAKMKEIKQKLINGKILFVELEEYLGKMYGNNKEKMVEEIISINVPEAKARERVKQLKRFHQLEACVDGAKTILNVAKAYELSGDFEVIRKIASQENTANKKMNEFDDSVLKICKFLKHISPKRTSCLDHFIKCKCLVQWLRKSMKGGLKELKVFVDLASISAGEGDMEVARVNCLHAATTGYAPLIFDLDENSGYKELWHKCKILWKELKADPDLPKKLLDTNRNLEWLKSVKQAHGSVEVTSLAQAESINSKGIFFVGALDIAKNTTVGLNLQNTLQLTMPDHDKESQGHRQYTFEQLQDLQSRLMLVAGKAEQGKDDVDRFMLVFDSVVRLAKVFIKLNSAGCVLFKHWQTKFLCDPSRLICALIKFGQGVKTLKGRRTREDNVTTVIPKIARFMENCLDTWIGHINQKRLEYLELNYFTTDQLVILQQELVKVGSHQDLDIRIYPLLAAVKENCAYEDLVEAMTKALKDLEEVQMEVDEERMEMEGQEDEDVSPDETKERDAVPHFIEEMIEAGFSEKLAEAALRHVKPDQITDGIIWCNDHALGKEEDAEMSREDHPAGEPILYEGWKKSDQSVMSITAAILDKLEVTKGDIDVDTLITDLKVLWKEFLTSVSSSVTDFLSVEHLGLILRRLAEKEYYHSQINRPFPPSFVPGSPNLIICPKADVLSTVLSMYMMDPNQPLPQADEVLMCTSQTTLDQLDVFWRRTVANTSRKIHCLVNGDLLDFEVSDHGERRLEQYMQESQNLVLPYRLVVICGAENEYKSRIITALDKFRRPPLPVNDIHHIANYIKRKLKVKEGNTAAAVDVGSSSVRVVKSWRAGVGKSLYVMRRNEKLMRKYPHQQLTDLVNIPLQEKEINISQVTQIFLTHMLPPGVIKPRIFHLDIAYEVQEGVDYFLFNLLILGCLTDKSGYVWKRSSRDLYLIETMPILESVQARKGGSASYVHRVFDFLPFLTCRSPQESLDILTNRQKPRDFKQVDPQFDLKEFNSSIFQMAYQYLSRLDQVCRIDDVDPSVPWGTPADCLNVLLRHCGVPDPSWAELHHFVWFFSTQLRDFRESNFCSATVAEDLPGFSKFVLKFLLQMSRDFSTRSLLMSEETPATMMEVDQELDEEEESEEEGQEDLAKYQMRRTWESSPHPYLFFNPDGHTITFLGFNIERQTGNLIDQQTRKVLETAIMPQNLYDSLVHNRVPIQEDFDSLPREKKIERLCLVMGNDQPHDPDDTYELTTDNVKKILAIYMRFRCDIPVIIMGETGCGKTRLVKFLSALQTPLGSDVTNMILMKVHGGTTNTDIKRKVEEARKIAQQNADNYGPHMYTVLFFDEANTTEAIGMIKEIMCDKSIAGKPLDTCDSLRFVAACNPYRKHSEALIKRLEQAGLGYHVDADKTIDRLGRVPMRRLVYRVQPLPQSLLPLVWDFGQLNTQTEDLYIRQMVRRYTQNGRLPNMQGLIEVISGVLTASQDFMRQQQDECSFVSLRDVERVLNVMSWFYSQSQKGRTLFNQMDEIIQPLTDEELDIEEEEELDEMLEEEELEEGLESEEKAPKQELDDITRSLVLALGVCYHACLKNRKEYRIHVAQFFRAPCHLPYGFDQMEREISRCQDVFLENVQLEKNIARNTALKENVFMMVTSIELRIPLFLVGKPGSSKSLAKTIVADAMQGNAAHKDLFREFKQVQMVSFQCSPLSTPDGIVGTFRQCAQFQKDKDLDRFVSVVVLDEVGLAEDSPRMPLKTLHPLLEDGCQGDEEPQSYKKVAFIGISNWALDPAKMNRGILVQREIPDLEELVNTAEGICDTKNHVYKHVKPFIEPLARSYLDLFEAASFRLREFFGLRDFYSLMKMIYSFVEQTNKPPTWHQLLHSIKRNFGGLDTINPVDTFATRLTMDRNAERQDGDPDDNTASLIRACLDDTNNTQSESRYLLLLTENYGALTIMQPLIPTRNNIITIFGSSFPSDQEYTQVCRNINRIKVCMETGNTVVLLNLENLYESLYDALNQYYVYFGGERYVDLGLGTHRVKCRVHKNFRLIVVAEKDVVYEKFPIPLINRLEKHFLTVNTILTREQSQLAEELEKWAKDFSTETVAPIYMQRNKKNKYIHVVGEVFMGYHADTCSSIILYVWQRLQEESSRSSGQKILDEAKRLLLWCATPDAVVRLEGCGLMPQEKTMLTQVYMKEQCHENLAQYLHFKLHIEEQTQELFAQITTHSKLLSTADKFDIHRAVAIPPERIALETLQSFDTEQQFNRKIRSILESSTKEEILLVVQCDSGDTNANLVACARYCIIDEHQQAKERRTAACHVILIIQLPRIAGGCFTGFQCGQWHSAHIDDLRAHNEESVMPCIMDMLGKSVGTLMERAVSTKSADRPDMEVEEIFKTNRGGQCAVAMETDDMETEMNATEIPRQVKDDGMEWETSKTKRDYGQDQGHELQDVINERVDHKLNVRSLILSSIQPALAMVKDKEETTDRSTQRIELMLYLLHQSPIEGLPSFLHGLSCHIVTLLKEKERTAFRADNWLYTEATKPENINKAGTFRQACIQYLESKISPLLAGIIAYIDTNHNLDIIHNHITSGDWKARLWLQILNTPGAIQLQYSDLQSPTRQQELNEVIIKTTGCEGQMFPAVMPFSWLIYEQIDGIWRTIQENQEEDKMHMKVEKIVVLVKETKLGQLLETLEGIVSSEDIGYMYAQDFTKMVYHAQSSVEHELVHSAIMQTSAMLLEDNTPNILARLVWIHESHNKIVQHLRYFRSINQVWPECAAAIRSMKEDNPDHFLLTSDQFTLGILGLCLVIEQLKPPDKNYLNNAATHHEWLQKICNYRPVIEKGLDLYSSVTGTRVAQAVVNGKQIWTRVTVVKLFIEHVVTSEKEAEKHGPKYIMPLWVMLGETPDLKQANSIKNIEKFLKMCNRAAIKDVLGHEKTCPHCEDRIEGVPVVLPCKDAICVRCYHDIQALGNKNCPKCSKKIPSKFDPDASGTKGKAVQKFKEYQSRCNSFFMDVVSQLCFADNAAPSDQVVDKLLGYITMTTPGKQGTMETHHLTKELTIFNDCVDPSPVFRSFLLQLLLRTSKEKVHSSLEKYFIRAKAVIGRVNLDAEVQLCQLVVQCLEDSFYLHSLKEDEVTMATKYLTEAEHDLKASPDMLNRLYGIAKARFGLAITAKHIQKTVLKKRQVVTPEQRQLIDRAATLCDADCKWPKIFFLKYLCRCYGIDSYQAVCKKNDTRYLKWIKFQHAEEKDTVREVSDRYLVCGPHYIKIREAVTKVVFGEGVDQLDKSIKHKIGYKWWRKNSRKPKEKTTDPRATGKLSHIPTSAVDKKNTKMPKKRMKYLLCLALHREITMSRLQQGKNSKVSPKAIEMLHKYCSEATFMKNKNIAQKILQNTYGVQSPFLKVTPGLDLKHQGVLCLLMHCDLVLRNLHGDSTLVQPLIRLARKPKTMRDSFIPTMPQDDVEEIRKVMLAHKGKDNPLFYRCPNGHPYVIGECGRPYSVSKCPTCGLEIGGESHHLRPGNTLDPGVDHTETGHILGRAENRTQIGPERSLTPAYCGIIRLLTHLTMMLGANISSLAVRQFIKSDITDETVPQFLWQHIEHDMDDLHRVLGKSLDDVFIIMHSILSGIMEKHNKKERLEDNLCGLMTKRARSDWEKMFSERFVVPILQNMENILNDCNQQLAQDKRLGSDPLLCLLYEIAQPQENISVEMLQEIPSMWHFRSRITMDHLRHQFEIQMMAQKKSQSQHKILQLFLKEEHHLRAIRYLPSILKLQRILFQKYQKKLDRSEAATITVEMLRKQSDGDELPRLLDDYAEVWDLIKEHLVFVPKQYRSCRIDDYTPMSQLLPTVSDAGQCAYSVLEFLFRKQNEFLDNYNNAVKRRVTERRVKVRDLTPAHLISYHPDEDILPLILANCNYSFEVGKGTTVEYNFTNLERQIMDRFLFGKSLIDIEIELMVYRAEYTNATIFRKLQEKIPQKPLNTGVKLKISNEFHSLPDLCQALDNLDIAVSFLKSIGGNPDNNLDKFMVETLKMKQSLYSPKAKQICQYQHAQSLWLLLSLEKNKKLALYNQMIFDGLPEQFHQQLSAKLTKQVMTFLQPLSLERLELLLELMFECIVLVISVPQNPDDEDYVDAKEKRFKDYLLALMTDKEIELHVELDVFPDDVLSKFCVATWTLAYRCLLEKKRQRY